MRDAMMLTTPTCSRSISLVIAGAVALAGAAAAQAQQPQGRTLFPQPLLVEHELVQTEGGVEVLRTPPVTDHYFGSWIVSVRPDKSRLIVDFGRRELIEVRIDQGTYSTLGFDRFAELQRRLQKAEGPIVDAPSAAVRPARRNGDRAEPRLVVRELAAGEGGAQMSAAATTAPHRRAGVTRVRVGVERDPASPDQHRPEVEAWLDAGVRLGGEARAALARFEQDVVGAGAGDEVTPAKLVAAAREWAEGRFVVRTEREAARGVRIVDEVTRIEVLPAFPVELLAIPEGVQQVPHVLELMVAHAESEAELNRAMSRVPAR